MKILITGASGFVGKRVLEQLNKKGILNQDITLLSSKWVPGYHCIMHNDYHFKAETFHDDMFDCIIHGGAVTPKGKEEDENKYLENIRTTVELFESFPVIPSKIVFLSSVSVYQKGQKINEESELETGNMYALSKIVCERFLEQFILNGVDVQILRLGAVYGPGEEIYNKIAGTFLKKAGHGENIIINSDGMEKRNMLFVDDAAEYICNAVLFEHGIGTVNIVSNEQISVLDLAMLAIKVTNSSSQIIVQNKVKGRNDNYDNLKMQKIFDKYKCFTSYECGMGKLYEYFKECGIL